MESVDCLNVADGERRQRTTKKQLTILIAVITYEPLWGAKFVNENEL